MKKIILIVAIGLAFFAGSIATPITNAAVEGITADNYLEYEKPNKDPRYGYNKGEAEIPYLEGEEQFYSEAYDHWNVDEVYDPEMLRKDDALCEEDEELSEEVTTKVTLKESNVCPHCGKEL